MVTKHVNNESAYKGIRFKHELINEIDASVEREKTSNPKASFSAWVIDACEKKLETEKSGK